MLATLSYLRFLPSPDQNVLSLSFCLSLHSYPAAESGNAVSDRAAEVVMMRAVLEILHTPRGSKVWRRSLVLIALPGALAMDQSKTPRLAVLVRRLPRSRSRCVLCQCLHLRLASWWSRLFRV